MRVVWPWVHFKMRQWLAPTSTQSKSKSEAVQHKIDLKIRAQSPWKRPLPYKTPKVKGPCSAVVLVCSTPYIISTTGECESPWRHLHHPIHCTQVPRLSLPISCSSWFWACLWYPQLTCHRQFSTNAHPHTACFATLQFVVRCCMHQPAISRSFGWKCQCYLEIHVWKHDPDLKRNLYLRKSQHHSFYPPNLQGI